MSIMVSKQELSVKGYGYIHRWTWVESHNTDGGKEYTSEGKKEKTKEVTLEEEIRGGEF